MTHTPHAPHTGCNPDAEILALRLVLAVAHNDYDTQCFIAEQMQEHNPGVIVRELACIAVDFARALGGDDFSYEGAVRVVEGWMQTVLDDREGHNEQRRN